MVCYYLFYVKTGTASDQKENLCSWIMHRLKINFLFVPYLKLLQMTNISVTYLKILNYYRFYLNYDLINSLLLWNYI